MKPFTYYRPSAKEEVVALLHQFAGRAKVIAGGTDLLIRMKRRQLKPEVIVDLSNVAELSYIYQEDGRIHIGATTKIAAVESSPLLREKAPVLAEAAHLLGSRQIRNLATLGGNICNAAPSGDTLPALLLLEAEAKILGPAGERVVALENFFVGPGQTVLAPDEILLEVAVKEMPPRAAAVYLKHSRRRAMDIAVVGVGVRLEADEGAKAIKGAKVVLGAVAPTPIRAPEAEAALAGKAPDAQTVETAASLAAAAARPISDVRASADYRREMVRVLTRRAVQAAWERVAGARER